MESVVFMSFVTDGLKVGKIIILLNNHHMLALVAEKSLVL